MQKKAISLEAIRQYGSQRESTNYLMIFVEKYEHETYLVNHSARAGNVLIAETGTNIGLRPDHLTASSLPGEK